MKTSTALILAGAGVLVVFVLTRKSSPALPATKGTGSTSLLGGLGQILGGLVIGAGGTTRAPSSPGLSTGTSGSNIGPSGDSEIAIVNSLDAGNIAAYDAQGTSTAPVYGIAGIDY